MICNKGVIALAICLDSKPPQVLVEGPDGRQQVCTIQKFWIATDPPRETTSPVLADTFTFEVLGTDEHGELASSRYDMKLQGLGPELPRNADGSFGSRAGQRLTDRLKANAAVLPAEFDHEGRH